MTADEKAELLKLADDDSWYFAEIGTLESELEALQKDRNKAEYQARNWRDVAD